MAFYDPYQSGGEHSGDPNMSGPPAYQPIVPYGYPMYAPPRPTNGMAIGALVVSILSLAMCGGLISPVGAILGHISRRQIRTRGEQGDGLALAGVIVGWVGTAFAVLLWGGMIALFAASVWFAEEVGPSIPTYPTDTPFPSYSPLPSDTPSPLPSMIRAGLLALSTVLG